MTVPVGPRKPWLSVIVTLAGVFLLAGCSAKQAIGNAAVVVRTDAVGIQTDIAAAKATGEVGPKAEPHLDAATAKAQNIETKAEAILDELPNVKDVEHWFVGFLRTSLWLVIIGGIVFVCIYFAPVLRPIILTVGAFLNLIPSRIRVQAKADAAYIADPTNIDNTDEVRIRAIEQAKADPRYKKILKQELARKGVPT